MKRGDIKCLGYWPKDEVIDFCTVKPYTLEAISHKLSIKLGTIFPTPLNYVQNRDSICDKEVKYFSTEKPFPILNQFRKKITPFIVYATIDTQDSDDPTYDLFHIKLEEVSKKEITEMVNILRGFTSF